MNASPVPHVTIHGTVHPRFHRVAEVFRENFAESGEVGAAVSAWVNGEQVVNLWAGVADTASGSPWQEHTMATIFSATKGLAAIAFLILEDRGELDLDEPVCTYWPEFAYAGKHAVTLRQILNHRAGLSAVDMPLTLEDFLHPERIEKACTSMRPMWKPGTKQGYSATSLGIFASAIFRRLTGEGLGEFLQREVFRPLGADVYMGLPANLNRRVATTYPLAKEDIAKDVLPKVVKGQCLEGRFFRQLLFHRSSPTARAFFNPSLGKDRLNRVNEPFVRSLDLPWMGAVTSATGLAKVWAALGNGGELDGVRIVSEAAIQRLVPRQSWAYSDAVLLKPMGFSQGFLKDEPHLISPNEAAFGHTGAGGTVGFADPTHNLGMAYIMNKMDHHLRSPRCVELCRAMYSCLQPV